MREWCVWFLLLCMGVPRAWSIMQVDVAGSMFPSGSTITSVSSSFASTYAPTVYRPNTSVIGPEDNFGNWAFIFDYDQGPLVMPSFASRRIVGDFILTYTCADGSSTTQHWNPEGEMTYVFDAAFPFYTYEYPTDFFTMVPFGSCPQCVVSPLALSLGTVAVNTTVQGSFQISNTGEQSLNGTVTESCAEFSIISGASYSLGAGQQHTVWVQFFSATPGSFTCSLDTGGACSDVVLSAEVYAPPLCAVDVTYLDFGTLGGGMASTRSFTLTNQGGGLLSGTVGTLTTPFVLLSTPDYSLAEGQSKTFQVRLQSDFLGYYATDLDLGTACGTLHLAGSVSQFSESFDHGGALASGWSVQSVGRSVPWAPLQEFGSDWAMETTHTAFQAEYDETLFSPTYDLTWWEDVVVGFTHQHVPAGGDAAFRTSSNGGLSWSTRNIWTTAASGDTTFDISSWADSNPNARFSFRFRNTVAQGGSSWRVDNFYLGGNPLPPVASAPIPNSNAGVEWSQLSGTLGCSWEQPLGIRGDSLQVRVDHNGDGDYNDGLAEEWVLLSGRPDAPELTPTITVSFNDNGIFPFEFRAKSGNGRWGYSGESHLEGIEDDWVVVVAATPPVAIAPIPDQPQTTPWFTQNGLLGCTWTHANQVDGASLALRRDMNGDGDYEDGGAENWSSLPVQPNGVSISMTAELAWAVNGTYRFELRAKGADGIYGYSGNQAQMGPADDWTVQVNADVDPPVFSDAIPTDQPNPLWVSSSSQQVGVSLSDARSGVRGESIAWRVDANHNGVFDDSELWNPLAGYSNGSQIAVVRTLNMSEDGQYIVQFRGSDVAGNGPALSDLLVVRADTTPPSAVSLFVTGASASSVELIFSSTQDLAFDRYEVHVSLDADVTLTDPVWGPDQDPALAIQGTQQCTVNGLNTGTPYWFQLWAYDRAGNASIGSNVVHKITDGTPVQAVTDLRATRTALGVLLTWSTPSVDEDGYAPVSIDHFDIHASDQSWFTPSSETLVGTTTESQYLVALSRTAVTQAYYQVVVSGAGMGGPIGGMVRVEPGSFTMGPDALGNGEAHVVSLTHPFWMDRGEVTNEDFVDHMQWAYDQGLVSATATSVMAHGQELVDLDDEDCEITFNALTHQFGLRELEHSTSWGGPGPAYPNGYNPNRHPAKEVTWYGAASYCDWRSLREGLTPFYNGNWSNGPTHNPYLAEGYRLPTEAEWEFVARYNDGRMYPWGNNAPEGCDWANLDCVGWTRPIGLYPLGTNQLGVMDLIGNVLEYTNDYWSSVYTSETSNPMGPTSGTRRSCRGSDCGDDGLLYATSTSRQHYSMSESYPWIGFRTTRCEEQDPPVAAFSLSPGNGSTWTLFHVDASASSDSQTPAELLEVRWDWNSDGTYDTEWSTGKAATHRYPVAGAYTLRLQVRDGAGLTAESARAVTVTSSWGPAVQVPAGSYQMGSPTTEAGRTSEEVQHPVTLTHDYLLGATEVTNAQFRQAALWAVNNGMVTLEGNSLYAFTWYLGVLPSVDDNYPVTNVNWYGAACYCDWLSAQEGLTPFYNGNWNANSSHNPYLATGFRLATEAEWEYACRAGSTTVYCFGDDPALVGDYAWYSINSGSVGHPVAQKLPNAWGLFDMHGNVWEFTNDWYGGALPVDAQTDPLGQASGNNRVHRGGSWLNGAPYMRSAVRASQIAYITHARIGFRLCRTLQ